MPPAPFPGSVRGEVSAAAGVFDQRWRVVPFHAKVQCVSQSNNADIEQIIPAGGHKVKWLLPTSTRALQLVFQTVHHGAIGTPRTQRAMGEVAARGTGGPQPPRRHEGRGNARAAGRPAPRRRINSRLRVYGPQVPLQGLPSRVSETLATSANVSHAWVGGTRAGGFGGVRRRP